MDNQPSGRRFRKAPQASLDRSDFRVAWPYAGLPAVLDPAAAQLLDCFTDPLSLSELADDLVAALSFEPASAQRSVLDFAEPLILSGHLIPEGSTIPSSHVGYPPSASP